MALIQVTPEVLNSKATEVRNLRSQHDDTMARLRSLILALKPKRFAEGAGETPWGLFLGAWSIDLCVYATLFVQALCRFA